MWLLLANNKHCFKQYMRLFTVHVTACSQSGQIESELSIFLCFRRSSVKNGGHIQPVTSEADTVMKELLQHNTHIPVVGLITTCMYCCRTYYSMHVLLQTNYNMQVLLQDLLQQHTLFLQHTCIAVGLTTYMYCCRTYYNIHVLLQDLNNIHVLLLDLIYMYLLQDCRTYYNIQVPAVGLTTIYMYCCWT